MVHLIEDFDEVPAVAAFLESVEVALPVAREWMETLLIRMVNDDAARLSLIQGANAANAARRDALIELLHGILR